MTSLPQQPAASMKFESSYKKFIFCIYKHIRKVHCCTVEHSDVHLGVAVTLHTPESYN